MTLNVDIAKSGNENSMQVIRKFSRRVQSSGLIPFMRKRRYWERPLSSAKKKQSALHRIKKASEREQLIKEGKMSDAPERGRRRPRFSMPSTSTPAPAAGAAPQPAQQEQPQEAASSSAE
ncbi:MAG TPA: 30S ribosomal protein S21 [Candidatus Paceibacterota bacterium]|nr:30S ribosomal protein S21 [Candidatus Paceibacterota bacterium]